MPDLEHPASFSEEQIAYVDERSRRSAHAAVRAYKRRALVGFAILAFGLGGSQWANSHDAAQSRKATVNSGRAVAVDGCNRDFRDKDDFRGVLIRLRVATAASPTSTPEQKRVALKFYDDTLANQTYPNCGKARSIVTDNPAQTIVVPRPLSFEDAKNADVKSASKRILKGE